MMINSKWRESAAYHS